MPRYRLLIAYDGTDFRGWQKQHPPVESVHADAPGTPFVDEDGRERASLRTVQGVVEEAVRAVVREPVVLLGASRTDAGVHARGQVAAFTCSPLESAEAKPPQTFEDSGPAAGASTDARRGAGWPLSRGADRLAMAINSRLPPDVQVLGVEATHANFDPIADAVSKGYSYTFHIGRDQPLWDRWFVRHVPRGPLNVQAMREAAAVLEGEHDFAAFAAAGHGRLTTVRTVHALSVREIGNAEGEEGTNREARGMSSAQRVRLDISGSGFLWNMVRIIAGTLLDVGLGRRDPASVKAALESRDRTRAGPTLGPEGLCLEWIRYG